MSGFLTLCDFMGDELFIPASSIVLVNFKQYYGNSCKLSIELKAGMRIYVDIASSGQEPTKQELNDGYEAIREAYENTKEAIRGNTRLVNLPFPVSCGYYSEIESNIENIWRTLHDNILQIRNVE